MLSDQPQKSMESFKVMSECPIILALLFQLHRNTVSNAIGSMLESIIGVLKLQPLQQIKAQQKADKEGHLLLGMAVEIDNRPAYTELKSLQVKVKLLRDFVFPCFCSQKYCSPIETI